MQQSSVGLRLHQQAGPCCIQQCRAVLLFAHLLRTARRTATPVEVTTSLRASFGTGVTGQHCVQVISKPLWSVDIDRDAAEGYACNHADARVGVAH
jgi:hypothetical protein